MKYNIMNHNLKVIVDELGEEYKDLLVEHVLDDMRETDIDLINPMDLICLDVEIKSSLRMNKRDQQKNKMFSLISVLGITYAILGLMLLMWREIKESMQYDTMMLMSFVLIFIGLFVALYSLMFKNIIKLKEKNYYKETSQEIYSYQIVDKWKEIEALVRELTPEEGKISLLPMIENLEQNRIISDKDVEYIKQLLSVRNKIVHIREYENTLSAEEKKKIILQADKIINKLKKLI